MPPFSRPDGISKVNNNESDKYAKEWERIFGKKKRRKQPKKDVSKKKKRGII